MLGLYLREVRTDFRRVWSFCRALIPMSRNPEFGSLVMQQFVVFYGLYTALRLRCLLGTFIYVRADTVDLVASLQRLQQGARAVVESLGPGFQPAYSGVR